MAITLEYLPLQLVNNEITEVMVLAQQAVEEYYEQPEDMSLLDNSAHYLHQVYGSLILIELYGAALLVEEMEQLIHHMINLDEAKKLNACEILMDAMLRLPLYLDLILQGYPDKPQLLLKVLNELRKVRQVEPLVEFDLFSPNLNRVGHLANELDCRLEEVAIDKVGTLKKIRLYFEFKLLQVLAGQRVKRALIHMEEVVFWLTEIYMNKIAIQYWTIASAFIEALHSDGLAITNERLKQLRKMDQEMKCGELAFTSNKMQSTLKMNMQALLVELTQTTHQGPRLEIVKQDFKLSDFVVDGQHEHEHLQVQGPDRETLEAVALVLKENLSQVEDTLDVYVRGDERDVLDLQHVVSHLNKIGAVFSLLGMDKAYEVLERQIAILQEETKHSHAEMLDLLLEVARDILYVGILIDDQLLPHRTLQGSNEDNVIVEDLTKDEQHIAIASFNDAKKSTLDEIARGLNMAKDNVLMFVNQEGDCARIADVPELLGKLTGALSVIQFKQSAELLGECQVFIKQHILAADTVPELAQMESLAEALTCIEYYIEILLEQGTAQQTVLDKAQKSVQQLRAC